MLARGAAPVQAGFGAPLLSDSEVEDIAFESVAMEDVQPPAAGALIPAIANCEVSVFFVRTLP